MRVLFVDFDGVLHPGPGVASSLSLWCWLPILVQALAGHEDVRIVVHSTWRQDHTVSELRELLGSLGEHVIDVTPEAGRLESIERWLEAHPEVTSYRILDDDESDFFFPLPPELILCDPERGISDSMARSQLRQWLNEA